MKRILVAGMGNLLRGDDGFGLRVIQQLSKRALPEGVELYEAGAAGVACAQKLMDGYDACIIVDAAQRGGLPGTVYRITPVIPEKPRPIGMHAVDPVQVLTLARAMCALPAQVILIGCEPQETEDLCQELSAPVAAALPQALQAVIAEIDAISASNSPAPPVSA